MKTSFCIRSPYSGSQSLRSCGFIAIMLASSSLGTYTDTDGRVQSYHPYSVVDSRLSWRADTYSLYVEGNNLLSHRYVDYGNVPQPGFWLMVGAKYHIAL